MGADRSRRDKAIQDLQKFWITTACGLRAQVSKQSEAGEPSLNLFLLGLSVLGAQGEAAAQPPKSSTAKLPKPSARVHVSDKHIRRSCSSVSN